MENHIKSYKRHLAADRTSCSRATTNHFRLFLHVAAYWGYGNDSDTKGTLLNPTC
jgi:hypothetical protein